jgi:polyisoprenyl-phosphate glycosyltransferase
MPDEGRSNRTAVAAARIDALISVVMVVHDAADHAQGWVEAASAILSEQASDYELVVVDNGSTDATPLKLQELCQSHRDLQVYSLAGESDLDIAILAGLEQAIGDYVVILDPALDDLAQIPRLIEAALGGHEIVLARRLGGGVSSERDRPGVYGFMSKAYIRLFKLVTGVDLRLDTPRYRLMSRRIVNFVLQHDAAYLVYQTVPVSTGFRRTVIEYQSAAPMLADNRQRSIPRAVSRGMALLINSSELPLRFATFISLLAAGLSLLYSVYVLVIYLFSDEVAPGWTTLSLQMSGLFFLLAMALAVMSEYVMHISRLASRRPLYHIASEFRSEQLTREQRLNVLRPETGKANDTAS